ncbi:hypothetical protein K432DRAFT_404373 [Lepidopterella palustris CBS 459.81]|uniref:Uncharacterized protein n=1 Tax=Lepidopterella palustris CBS 459.81 TaxID=1314670 RepID=A0A8E2JG79_9PEZI|nr:hypothetical protein K432DRAFT_404373 [Lepidopterella palustris CBS 459.81]
MPSALAPFSQLFVMGCLTTRQKLRAVLNNNTTALIKITKTLANDLAATDNSAKSAHTAVNMAHSAAIMAYAAANMAYIAANMAHTAAIMAHKATIAARDVDIITQTAAVIDVGPPLRSQRKATILSGGPCQPSPPKDPNIYPRNIEAVIPP